MGSVPIYLSPFIQWGLSPFIFVPIYICPHLYVPIYIGREKYGIRQENAPDLFKLTTALNIVLLANRIQSFLHLAESRSTITLSKALPSKPLW